MFLNYLNEREGKLFLELADIAMKVDGTIDERELNIMDTYRREMNLLDYEVIGKNEDDIISLFQGSWSCVKI